MLSNLKRPFRVATVFCLIAFIVSCKTQYMQLLTTSSGDAVLKDDFFVFENDTVKITYQFWANRGILSFELFNKLEKPIYIDWKNSSYIFNGVKMNYWIDEELTNSVSVYGNFLYTGPVIKPNPLLTYTVGITSSTSVKPERITFIPPKSSIYKTSFFLVPFSSISLDSANAKISVVPRIDKPKKKTKTYEVNYTLTSSPIVFRNFISLMFSESSKDYDDQNKNYKYIDNQFYVSYIKQEDIRLFWGKSIGTGSDGYPIYEKPEKKPAKFYLEFWQ